MKKSTKGTLAVLFLLIVVFFPLYYYTRPETTEPGTLLIRGKVNNPLNLTLTQLEDLQSMTLQVTLTSSSRLEDNGVFNYTGVLLGDLLNEALANDNADSVYIQASDGYGTTINIKEVQSQNILIAYLKDGSPLRPLREDGEGPFRLIIANDQYAQRWVRDVVKLEVN